MAFVPRTAEEILNDAINYVTVNTNITDFNVGSVIRTLLEAVALEDASQYAQMLNILNSFFLANATGGELNSRAAEYNITRKEATPSTGTVQFLDLSLEKAYLVQDLLAGVSSSIAVDDASVFPTAFPFNVRLGEGTGAVETVSITAVNTTTNILTSAAPVQFNHAAAGSLPDAIDNLNNLVCLVSGLPDRTIAAGITLRSRASNVNVEVDAYTTLPGIHPNGNFASNPINVTTKNFGSGSVIPVKSLNQIIGSPPYFDAGVINTSAVTGGASAESDVDLRARIRNHVAGLSAGTVGAIKQAILDASSAADAERITKVNILEDFEKRVAYAYVNTGSETFIGNQDLATTDTTSAIVPVGATVIPINSLTGFPEATIGNPQFLIIDPGNANSKLKVIQYIIKGGGSVTSSFTLNTFPVVADVPLGTQVGVPEVVTPLTEFNKKYYSLINFPLSDDTFLLYEATYVAGAITDASTIKLLVEGTDYIINRAIGQIEFLEGKVPLAGRAILALYNYYTGIIKTAQTAVDGNLEDPLNSPGVRSAGVKVRVLPALRESVDFVVDATFDSEITNFETVQFLTEQAIRSYVASLDVGGNIIIAEIIDRVMDIIGVINVHVNSPSGDVAILHDHYATVGIITVS